MVTPASTLSTSISLSLHAHSLATRPGSRPSGIAHPPLPLLGSCATFPWRLNCIPWIGIHLWARDHFSVLGIIYRGVSGLAPSGPTGRYGSIPQAPLIFPVSIVVQSHGRREKSALRAQVPGEGDTSPRSKYLFFDFPSLPESQNLDS